MGTSTVAVIPGMTTDYICNPRYHWGKENRSGQVFVRGLCQRWSPIAAAEAVDELLSRFCARNLPILMEANTPV